MNQVHTGLQVCWISDQVVIDGRANFVFLGAYHPGNASHWGDHWLRIDTSDAVTPCLGVGRPEDVSDNSVGRGNYSGLPDSLLHGQAYGLAGHYFDLMHYLIDAEPICVFAKDHFFGRDKPRLAGIDDLAVDAAEIEVIMTGGHVLNVFVN